MMNHPGTPRSLNRYDRFMRKRDAAAGSATGVSSAARLRHRYEVIFARNRELFEGARVLDLMSSSGFWSLAALDAGAAHVVGVESSPAPVEAAQKTFGEYGVNPGSYRFIKSEAPAALRSFDAKTFDVVLCHGFLELSDARFFFQQISRLKPKYVVLDTRIVLGKGPIIRLKSRSANETRPKTAERDNTILAIPNHELITFFCDYFQFRSRLIDWQSAGITDWSSVSDYELGRRQTYILEGAVPNAPPRER
jgi:SAM-dependent methyltransferase